MEAPQSDFRKIEREPYTKHFAINENMLKGRTNVEKFEKYTDFSEASNMANTC